MFQIILFSLFSFSVFFSIFISDKIKYSNNKYIQFIPKFVIFNTILALIVLIGLTLYSFFDVSIFNAFFNFCDSESKTEIEGTSTISSNSLFLFLNNLFLFLNKLPLG